MTTGNSLINLGDLSQPVTTLIEKISNAIGVIYEPTKIRRNAKAEVEAHRITVLAGLDLQNEVEHRAMQRMLVQETRKQNNIENIIQKTVEELPEDAQVDSLNEDWLANFFDKCENISDEVMQTMWSKILTDEASRPGAFSKRTIGIVSNISKAEAETFSRFCQFVWNLGFPCPIVFNINEDKILLENDILFSDLNHLQAIGLITISSSESYIINIINKKLTYKYFNKTMLFEVPEEMNNKLPVGACLLTEAGMELFKICKPQSNVEYLNNIFKIYEEKGIVVKDITANL